MIFYNFINLDKKMVFLLFFNDIDDLRFLLR